MHANSFTWLLSTYCIPACVSSSGYTVGPTTGLPSAQGSHLREAGKGRQGTAWRQVFTAGLIPPPCAVDIEITNTQQPGHLELPEWTKPPERRGSEARPRSCRSVGVNSNGQPGHPPPPTPASRSQGDTQQLPRLWARGPLGLAAGVGGAGCGPDSPTATRHPQSCLNTSPPAATGDHWKPRWKEGEAQPGT